MPEQGTFTDEMHSCIEQVMSDQDKDKNSAIAICITSFQGAGKQIYIGEAVDPRNRVYLEGQIKLFESNKVKGSAIHPMISLHPNDWFQKRTYYEEELIKAAQTLADKPFLMDHLYELPKPNVVTKSFWNPETSSVDFEGEVSDEIAEQIKNDEITKVSIELDWARPGGGIKYVDGIAPFNFEFTGLSLLKNLDPGDPETYIELWEAIISPETEEFLFYLISDPKACIRERFSISWIDQENGIQAIYGLPIDSPEDKRLIALLFMRANLWDSEKMEQWLRDHPEYIKPTTAPGIQASPNVGEAGVEIMSEEQPTETPVETPKAPELDEHGCKVGEEVYDVEQGKCVPLQPSTEVGPPSTTEAQSEPKTDAEKAKSHFEISDEDWDILSEEEKQAYIDKLPEPGTKQEITEQAAELTVDEIKAKITELNQQKTDIDAKLYPEAELTEEERTNLQAQLDILWAEIQAYEQALAAKIAGQATQPPITEPTEVHEADLMEARKNIVDLKATIANLEKDKTTIAKEFREFRQKIENALPPRHIIQAWGFASGAARLVQDLRKVIREHDQE